MKRYITTYTGIRFYPAEPDPEGICIEDIAHALSVLCRGNGHVSTFWSVAQHCIVCAREAAAREWPDRLVLACLLHDAGECYLSDVPRPFKERLTGYREHEDRLLEMIYRRYLGSPLSAEESRRVKEIDDGALYYDLKVLLHNEQSETDPSFHVLPDYRFRDFQEVEQEYLRLFDFYYERMQEERKAVGRGTAGKEADGKGRAGKEADGKGRAGKEAGGKDTAGKEAGGKGRAGETVDGNDGAAGSGLKTRAPERPLPDYALLADRVRTFAAEETDTIPLLANASALLKDAMADVNWAGFYLRRENGDGRPELVLGPFQGKPACIRIPWGRGVCGTAAKQNRTLLVPDVHAFPGHIACDSASRAEIVVPLHDREGTVTGVLDLDSPLKGRFTEQDREGLERFAEAMGCLPQTSRGLPGVDASKSGRRFVCESDTGGELPE